MNAEELFSALEVASESPKLKWVKRHKIRQHFAEHMCGPHDNPYCAWLPSNDALGPDLPNVPDACGYGKTADDALTDLAVKHGLRLWFETPDSP